LPSSYGILAISASPEALSSTTPRPPSLPPDDVTHEQLYLSRHLELIERIVVRAGQPGGGEDFGQPVHEKLIEDDYTRIRQFRGGAASRPTSRLWLSAGFSSLAEFRLRK
jgi:hypothetical protein